MQLTATPAHHAPRSPHETSSRRGFCVIAGVLVSLCAIHCVAATSDAPRLHYLNWMPGSAVLIDFLSGFAVKFMAVAMFAYGLVLAIATRSAMTFALPAATALLLGIPAFHSHVTKRAMEFVGVSAEQCWNQGTFECVTNDFHRRYDFGWQRVWTSEEQASYAVYVTLRNVSGPVRGSAPNVAHFVQLNQLVFKHASALNAPMELHTCTSQWQDVIAVSARCGVGHFETR